MKLGLSIISLLFVGYTGFQSYQIASAGIQYQVAQLEGDGGAGLVFTFFCFLSALLALVKPLLGVVMFLLSALLAVFAGLLYGDGVMMLWAVAPALLAGANGYVQITKRRKQSALASESVGRRA